MSNKEEIVVMTAKEIKEKYPIAKEDMAMFRAAPEYEADPNPSGRRVARGFAAFKEYINRKGRPKAKDPKVSISIRIPLSRAAALRATGPGWQTRTSDFVLEEGIEKGRLVPPELLNRA
jgi:uncharacterized protein (DUF4415 family)